MRNLTPERVIALDFETYYAQDYTLSGREYNTSSYVRDPQFEAHCVGVKIGTAPVEVWDFPRAKNKLAKLDWKNSYLLSHNTAFDGFILGHHYGITPYKYLDTLSMSRALFGLHLPHTLNDLAARLELGEKVHGALEPTKGLKVLPPEVKKTLMEYCGQDVELCAAAFWKLYPSFPDKELELVSMTIRMFADPRLMIDIPRVTKFLLEEQNGKTTAIAKARMLTGITPEELMSTTKFVAVLERVGNMKVPMKVSKATGATIPAIAKTDIAFRKLLKVPEVASLVEARLKLRSTIGETRAERFLEAGADGLPLPVLLNYWGAHTGRWSGGNKMNLQNLTKGGELRKSILAPPGYRIVVADSSQIEARVTAWLAGHGGLLQAFADGSDVYRLMAAHIYGIRPDQVTPEQRQVGKIAVLGLGYGMGAEKFQDTLAKDPKFPLDMPLVECRRIVRNYRVANKQITELWSLCTRIIEMMATGEEGQHMCLRWGMDHIRLPNDMKLLYPNLRSKRGERGYEMVFDTRNGHTKIYGGLLTENIVQAIARLIVAEQMLEIDKIAPVVTMSHDEVVSLAPDLDADRAAAEIAEIMKAPPHWATGLPLNVDVKHDTFYCK